MIAASGAGRPLGIDGFPAGPWTPELLSDAISQVNHKQSGVDLRTVQLWFQDNDKGIGPSNIRWLARILGCDDPDLTGQWQIELVAAQARLIANRRSAKSAGRDSPAEMPDLEREVVPHVSTYKEKVDEQRKSSLSLALTSEALFSRGSPLNLPSSIFAGATALGFLSFMIGIHNVTYTRADGVTKQVGFIWAPNWTILFMVLLPLFFAFVIELLAFWKKEGRLKLAEASRQPRNDEAWLENVRSFSGTFWAVFVICVFVAGVAQWIGVSVIPLTNGSRDYAIDWGKLVLVRPEIVSVSTTLVFTGLAYLYMSVSFYLFFAGLILLFTIIQDLWRSGQSAKISYGNDFERLSTAIGLRVISGVFRCTILGLTIAICMKVQSAYLASNGRNIVDWISDDAYSLFVSGSPIGRVFTYRMPTHYSSLLVAISSCVVFVYGAVRIGFDSNFHLALRNMAVVVALLFCAYISIDAFRGFTIFLGFGVVLATCGLVNPGMLLWRVRSKQGI